MAERDLIVWNWEEIIITEYHPDAYFPQGYDRLSVGNWVSTSYRPYYHFDMFVWPRGGYTEDGQFIARNTTIWEWVEINSDSDYPI